MEKDINISFEQFILSDCIFFERVEEGFEKYPYGIIEGTEEELFAMLTALYSENGEEHSFVDFYFHKLKQNQQQILFTVLNEEQISYIQEITKNANTVYYKLTKELLEITAILNAKEMLFCTYYFSKFPCTIWGNYGRKYPIFYKDKGMREKIEGIISCKRKNMDYLHL